LRIGAVAAALLVGVLASAVASAAPSGWLALDGGIRFNPASGATYDWANSGSGAPTYVCAAGAVNLSGPGGLFNCGRPSGGTGPPIAPSLTPAAAADASIISAVFVVDPIASDTTACGAGDPTIIAGGAKNGDALTSIGTSSRTFPIATRRKAAKPGASVAVARRGSSIERPCIKSSFRACARWAGRIRPKSHRRPE